MVVGEQNEQQINITNESIIKMIIRFQNKVLIAILCELALPYQPDQAVYFWYCYLFCGYALSEFCLSGRIIAPGSNLKWPWMRI